MLGRRKYAASALMDIPEKGHGGEHLSKGTAVCLKGKRVKKDCNK
jgi:hypothetical protein